MHIAGANSVDYAELRNLPVPAATPTHVPIPHYRVVDLIAHSLSYYGHEVVEQHHGATPDGMRYFGVLTLKSPHTDYTDMVGLRNSHDKKFPIGIGFGSRVFICDNMAFSTDHFVRRKRSNEGFLSTHARQAETGIGGRLWLWCVVLARGLLRIAVACAVEQLVNLAGVKAGLVEFEALAGERLQLRRQQLVVPGRASCRR